MGFKNTFNFSVKSKRGEFWYFFLFFLIAYLSVWILDELFFDVTVDLNELPLVTFLPLGYIDPEVGLIVLLFRPVMVVINVCNY